MLIETEPWGAKFDRVIDHSLGKMTHVGGNCSKVEGFKYS